MTGRKVTDRNWLNPPARIDVRPAGRLSAFALAADAGPLLVVAGTSASWRLDASGMASGDRSAFAVQLARASADWSRMVAADAAGWRAVLPLIPPPPYAAED